MSNIPEKPGCPDGDWCRSFKCCFWDCQGDEARAWELKEDEAIRAELEKNGERGWIRTSG